MMTYNGWANHSTWAVHLWLTNDEGTYRYFQGFAREAETVEDLSQEMEAEVWEAIDRRIGKRDGWVEGIIADFVQGSLSEVNWDEIAKAFWEARA